MSDSTTLMLILLAIENFGDKDRGGAVKLAHELREAVQRMTAAHEQRVARLIAKARRQNDRAWNKALDAAWHELEMELGNGEQRANASAPIRQRTVGELMEALSERLEARRREVREIA